MVLLTCGSQAMSGNSEASIAASARRIIAAFDEVGLSATSSWSIRACIRLDVVDSGRLEN